MNVTVILADSAQADQMGKVHALGLGWTVTGTPTPPQAVVLLIDVDWTETNQKYRVAAKLLSADGAAVFAEGPTGPVEVGFEGEFEAGRPAGIPHGTPSRIPVAVNIGPGLPLVPNERYVWHVSIDDRHEAGWEASFLITPNQVAGF